VLRSAVTLVSPPVPSTTLFKVELTEKQKNRPEKVRKFFFLLFFLVVVVVVVVVVIAAV
jgi:cytoskeletal protein RodZ